MPPTKGAPTSAMSNPIKVLSVRREPALRLAPPTPHTRGSPGGRVFPDQPSEFERGKSADWPAPHTRRCEPVTRSGPGRRFASKRSPPTQRPHEQPKPQDSCVLRPQRDRLSPLPRSAAHRQRRTSPGGRICDSGRLPVRRVRIGSRSQSVRSREPAACDRQKWRTEPDLYDRPEPVGPLFSNFLISLGPIRGGRGEGGRIHLAALGSDPV